MQKPTISIYGPFQALDSSGNRVDLASTKARHILTALILAHPEPVQRELLCRMIWPESSDDSRKTRLRQELAIIRDFATRIHCENMLVVQPGFLALSIDGFGVDCFESRKHYLAYSSTLPVDERIHNLTEQVKLMQRGQIAPDALTLFETERKRKESRLTTAQIDLTKLYIEVRRYPEARKVLDALLDMQPDNETAQVLNKRLLEAEVEVPKEGRTEPPKRPDSPVAAKWKVPIAIALVSIATVVIVNRPSKVALGPSTPITLVKSPPISQIIAYQHTPAPDEFDESEFIGVARAPDGMTAVAGIVKTKTEDVDGLVTLLGPDLKPKWTRKFTSAGHDCDRLESVCFDGEKNVFAAGETYVVNQPNIKDGWYGTIVSYDANGKPRFQCFTRRKIIHGSEVKRRVVADERGGAWFCSSTAETGKDQIFATHVDRTGRIINDIVISGVQAKVVAFSRHTQDEYCVIANAKSSPTSAAGDWFMTTFTYDGRILWTSQIDGPAKADDVITSEVLATESEYHFVAGLMTSSKTPNDVPHLLPTLASINVHTGAVGRQVTLKSDIANPYVSLFDLSRKGEIHLTVQESAVDSRQPITLDVLDAVTGAVKHSGKVTLPDGQYLTQVRRFVSNPKTGTMQLITNTARDIGTNQSQGIVISTQKTSGQTTHEIFKNVDRVTLNAINQTVGVGQVDMGRRWPATVFALPYPD